ncbi:MAG: type II secretion system F family protein, partial [Phycisphaerae bacterium]|nr:type II secretion system F family protein [Phycisphaerae bacterium]
VTNRRLGNVMLAVRQDVAAGAPLADAISFHPRVFAPLHAAMVRAGERAGFLEDVLSNLAEFIERQDELRGKVLGAMIYPLILTVLGSGAVLGILILLVPQFKPVFEGISLPAPTVFLFGLSDLLILHWPIVLAGAALIVLGALGWARSGAGRLSWDRWRVRIPVFGLAVRMVAVTRFCRILGTMLANGVPILQALAISKDATGSAVLSESIEQAIENVRAGETLAAPLAQSGIFPPQILEMIGVAEESNQMEKVLIQIADTFERRTNRQVDQAVRLIEPLILVLIAAVIGFVATGLMFPIFKMAQTLG